MGLEVARDKKVRVGKIAVQSELEVGIVGTSPNQENVINVILAHVRLGEGGLDVCEDAIVFILAMPREGG